MLVIPNTCVSCVNGTAEQEGNNTGSKNIGHQGYLLILGTRIFCAKVLSIRRKYCCHHLILKLGTMKQFVKALPKTGNCFKYLCKTLPHLSEAKLKEDVFVGPDIRKLIFNEDFLLTMTEVEREAWIAFKSVVTKFLGNNKDPDYVTIVATMVEKFKVFGCLMSFKIHFLNSHLDFFPKILV
jgi:hypothetical protein